jgi:hypothetical protein
MTYSDTDLTDLGFVLLECMEGHPLPQERRDTRRIRDQRKANQVFGLTNAEKWSGSKQLVDFLDDVFNEERSTNSKFQKPVSYDIRDLQWNFY